MDPMGIEDLSRIKSRFASSTMPIQNSILESGSKTLDLFPPDRPHKFGMVEIDNDCNVLSTIDKPKNSQLTHMWGACCWSPAFTQLIDTFLVNQEGVKKETVLGDVFDEALRKKCS